MSERKIIAVLGATGAQGGGLVRAIAGDGKASLRPAPSLATRALQRPGSSPRSAPRSWQPDVDDPASLERVLEGAYGAYFVTFFWAHFSPEREMAEARNMADAARLWV